MEKTKIRKIQNLLFIYLETSHHLKRILNDLNEDEFEFFYKIISSYENELKILGVSCFEDHLLFEGIKIYDKHVFTSKYPKWNVEEKTTNGSYKYLNFPAEKFILLEGEGFFTSIYNVRNYREINTFTSLIEAFEELRG